MIAVEPSAVMRAQATPHERVAWLEGVAEQIPIADNGVGGVVSTLALHHFADLSQAFREMARVVGSGPIVLFTFDTAAVETLSLWMRDYRPRSSPTQVARSRRCPRWQDWRKSPRKNYRSGPVSLVF
jgi:ubiquinone/menaquinone biosynthesis C-methylase UbiE